MSDHKIIIILIYIIVIIIIPPGIDNLFNLTIRNKKKKKIYNIARELSRKQKKPLIIFDTHTHGVLIENRNSNREEFDGDVTDIIKQLKTNSCILIVSNVLEYIELPENFINDAKRASNGNVYFINYEKNSPRGFYDNKIKRIINKSYYMPMSEKIEWTDLNLIHKKIQRLYSFIYKFVPYSLFTMKITDNI